MGAIIRQTVREKLRRSNSSESETVPSGSNIIVTKVQKDRSRRDRHRIHFHRERSTAIWSSEPNSDGSSGKSSSNKKRKIEKQHRLQVRWMHYDQIKKKVCYCLTKEWR